MLKIEHLTLADQQDKLILNNISFNIKKNNIVALLGKNGAGKTTLMETVMLLHQNFQGELFFNEKQITPQVIQKKFGFMEADPFFYKYLTVEEMLEYLCLVRNLKNTSNLVNEWLEKVNLADKRKDPVHSLSKGMKQRLNLAMSLLHQPEILFLDEPFNALDQDESRNLCEIIKDYSQNSGILISTHIFSFLPDLATDVIFLQEGLIEENINLNLKNPWTLTDYEENFAKVNN